MLDALWGGQAVVTGENGRVWAHSRVGDASARRPSILADRAARVAINMALLTELFASPPPPLRRVKDACKVQARWWCAQDAPDAPRPGSH